MAWVDVAKGACIVLVVLLHVTNKHLVRLDDASAAVRGSYETFVSWMRPVRMPLFFLLSGLLASSVLQRRDPAKVRRRVTRSFELYVVWLTLHTVVVDRRLRPNVETNSLDGFLDALAMPTGNLWYLWALAVYVGVLALVPPRLRGPLLAALGVVWLATAMRWVQLAPRPRDLLQYAGWFAFGAFVPSVVKGAVHRATGRTALLAVAGFVAATALLRPLGPVANPALQVLGVTAGLAVAACVRGRAAHGLAVLGRRTLPIYVLHVPLLTVWSHVLRERGWRGASPVPGLLWLYPVVLAAALIAASLVIERSLRVAGAGRLFGDRPGTQLVRRARVAQPSSGGIGQSSGALAPSNRSMVQDSASAPPGPTTPVWLTSG